MNTENKNNKPDEIWSTLSIIGYVTIMLSLIGGLFILIAFGEANAVGMASGIAVIIQGSIIGIVLVAFSTLGKSVNRIELKLLNDNN